MCTGTQHDRRWKAAGCDDIPRTAVFVLADLDHSAPESAFRAQTDVVASLGLSKQTASQLIDTLVLREYLERRVDPGDRRRMGVRLIGGVRTRRPRSRRRPTGIDATIAQLITVSRATRTASRPGSLQSDPRTAVGTTGAPVRAHGSAHVSLDEKRTATLKSGGAEVIPLPSNARSAERAAGYGLVRVVVRGGVEPPTFSFSGIRGFPGQRA